MYSPSTAEIEKQILNYRLHFGPVKDAEVEWRFQAPPFVSAFVRLTEDKRRVPSQADFCDYYVRSNQRVLQAEFAEKWPSLSTRTDKELALIARLERAYPSFVRDLYFLALLRENAFDAEYHPDHDIENGVDFVVRENGTKLSIHVFLATDRARRGRSIKERRHTYAGHHMDVIVRPEECKQVGAFWLPSLVHVEQVKQHLQRLNSDSVT